MKNKIIYDEKELYSKLFLYKSFIYKNVEFETSLQDRDVKSIVKALNIKNKNKRIEFVYDYSCKIIDEFYSGKNICQFKDGKCISNRLYGKNKNGCCRNCIYQSDNGCITKNLSCKIFYCDKIRKDNNIIKLKDIKILKLFSLRQRFIAIDGFFANREELLCDLKIGLIVCHSIRCFYRELRNSINSRKIKK